MAPVAGTTPPGSGRRGPMSGWTAFPICWRGALTDLIVWTAGSTTEFNVGDSDPSSPRTDCANDPAGRPSPAPDPVSSLGNEAAGSPRRESGGTTAGVAGSEGFETEDVGTETAETVGAAFGAEDSAGGVVTAPAGVPTGSGGASAGATGVGAGL
jgi:hypothetical protein